MLHCILTLSQAAGEEKAFNPGARAGSQDDCMKGSLIPARPLTMPRATSSSLGKLPAAMPIEPVIISVPGLDSNPPRCETHPTIAPFSSPRGPRSSFLQAARSGFRSRQDSLQPSHPSDISRASAIEEPNMQPTQGAAPSDSPVAVVKLQTRFSGTPKGSLMESAMRSANLAGLLDELPTKKCNVEIHALGTFLFKGIAKPRRIVQVRGTLNK